MNIRGRLFEYDRPAVMGILNATPDSFWSGSRSQSAADVAAAAERMIEAGVDIIDVGACSTRPGQDRLATEAEEIDRLRMALPVLREISTTIPVSVDTFRASVARICVEELGADIINDISMAADPAMIDTVAGLHVPYVLSHNRAGGSTDYPHGVTADTIGEMAAVYDRLRLAGVADIIVDPGLGFAKTVEQNWRLLADIPVMAEAFSAPVLIGLSRKSMLCRPLGITSDRALNATVAADTLALTLGASIIRVHDVEAARQTVEVVELLRTNEPGK